MVKFHPIVSITQHNKAAKGAGRKDYPAEHLAWKNMIRRCRPTSRSYRFYGGRGITVCPQWRDSFIVFLSDVGLRPTPQHSIDRINNDGNYEPNNVRWATKTEQAENRGYSVFLTWNGRTQTKTAWAREIGCSLAALNGRLKYGWPLERALTKQPWRETSVTWNGITKTIAEWARVVGVPYFTLHRRLTRYGWSPERALTKPGGPKRGRHHSPAQ